MALSNKRVHKCYNLFLHTAIFTVRDRKKLLRCEGFATTHKAYEMGYNRWATRKLYGSIQWPIASLAHVTNG